MEFTGKIPSYLNRVKLWWLSPVLLVASDWKRNRSWIFQMFSEWRSQKTKHSIWTFVLPSSQKKEKKSLKTFFIKRLKNNFISHIRIHTNIFPDLSIVLNSFHHSILPPLHWHPPQSVGSEAHTFHSE